MSTPNNVLLRLCLDQRDIIDIYVNIPELVIRFFKPGINFGEREYAAMKELQQVQKRFFASPLFFKTRAIADQTFPPEDALFLLQHVDPQVSLASSF